MLCVKCGSDNPEDASACSHCGAPLAPAQNTTQSYAPPRLAYFSSASGLIGLLLIGISYLAKSFEFYTPALLFSAFAILTGIISLFNSLFAKKVGKKWSALGIILGTLGIYFLILIGIEITTDSFVHHVRAEMHTVTFALGEYYKNLRTYPEWSSKSGEKEFNSTPWATSDPSSQPTFRLAQKSAQPALTTPFAYISSIFSDPYASVKGSPFCYWTNATATTSATGYILWSAGPDGVYDLKLENIGRAYDFQKNAPTALLIGLTYDPSNGINSEGDIWRTN